MIENFKDIKKKYREKKLKNNTGMTDSELARIIEKSFDAMDEMRAEAKRIREEFKAENGFEMPEIDEPFDRELPDGAIAHNCDELEEWYASRGERF